MSKPSETSPRLLTSDPVELRRLLCAAVERVAELEQKRSALEETLHGMKADEERLQQRLSGVLDDGAALAATIVAKLARTDMMQEEVDEANLRRVRMERQCAENMQRVETLGHEAEALREQIGAYRQARRSGACTLRSIHDSVVRMDRKVDLEERKRACQGDAVRASAKDTAES